MKYSITFVDSMTDVRTASFTDVEKYTEVADDDTTGYTYETVLTIPAREKLGYTFTGWKVEAVDGDTLTKWDTTTDTTTAYTGASGYAGNVKLTAQWTLNTYTATLSAAEGETVDFTNVNSKAKGDGTITYTVEDDITGAPKRTGYDFDGWSWTSTDADKQGWTDGTKYGTKDAPGFDTANLTGAVTLTPTWTPHVYTITFADTSTTYQNYVLTGISAQKGEDTARNPAEGKLTYTILDTLAGAPTKTAYDFSGWTVAATSEGSIGNWTTGELASIAATGKYGDVTLTANWTAHSYTITFASQISEGAAPDYSAVKAGDTEVSSGTLTYTIEQKITGDPTKADYKFNGWKVTSADTAWSPTTFAQGAEVGPGNYGDVTLESQWNADVKFAFADYRYAFDNDVLMLVDWDTEDGKELTFDTLKLYKVDTTQFADEKFSDVFKTKTGSDAEHDLYVTIVPVGWMTSAETATKFAIGSGTNPVAAFSGDVVGANATDLDQQISLADLSNASDLFENHNLFSNTEISLEGRLNANKTADAFGSIDDLVGIMRAMGTSTGTGG